MTPTVYPDVGAAAATSAPGNSVRGSALAAACLTATGAATISAFFAAGQPWGTINDLNTIALAASTVPIAVGLRAIDPSRPLLIAALGSDLVGAVVTIGASGALLAGLGTFEGTLPVVLTGQALIGLWLVLNGVGLRDRLRRGAVVSAVMGGLGLMGTATGFALGGNESLLTSGAGALALVGTVIFYAQLGLSRAVRK